MDICKNSNCLDCEYSVLPRERIDSYEARLELDESPIVTYARYELNLACPPTGNDEEDKMQCAIHQDIINIIKTFADQGHSGTSAGYVFARLKRLMMYKPLTSLTGEDDEWVVVQQCAKTGKILCEQNRRCFSVFRRHQDNNQAYDISGKIFSDDGGKNYFSWGKRSRVPVTFPYWVPDSPEKIILNKDEDWVPDSPEKIILNKDEESEEIKKGTVINES